MCVPGHLTGLWRSLQVELPTVRMAFMVNTSAFAGNEGKYVTSRNLRDRLMRELERNLALRVDDGEAADSFIVSGRGTLHISILIENMRREGYEMAVGPPRVSLPGWASVWLVTGCVLPPVVCKLPSIWLRPGSAQ